MQANQIQILRLVARKKPALIGVAYQNKNGDKKKKVYTILLLNLIHNPNIEQIVNQIYREHAHILTQDKIPKLKVARLVGQIQQALMNEESQDYDQDYQHQEQQDHEQQQHGLNARPPNDAQQVDDYDFDDDGRPQLNRSF